MGANSYAKSDAKECLVNALEDIWENSHIKFTPEELEEAFIEALREKWPMYKL